VSPPPEPSAPDAHPRFRPPPAMPPVRTRFAPSPTGDLHLGNLRVAVFNYLFARHHEGTLVLRVEDTDRERNRPGALEGILDDLRWAGLDWDEGPDRPGPYGPYRQSERGELYRTAALRLLAEGRAYRCFCSDEEIETARAEGGGLAARGCPGLCRELSGAEAEARLEEGVPAALRFRVGPDRVVVEDSVRGDISFEGHDVGDFVVLRADGRPTYNFAVVVDDIAMRITHVIRGAGHLSNTPKHALLFDAMGAERPVFVHLPMVLGQDRRKLSKREGAEGVRALRAEGFHPDGVVNYLSLLGWSPGEDREILSRGELVREMSLDRIGASNTVFDPEKLRWVSQQHLARMSTDALLEAVGPFAEEAGVPLRGERLRAGLEAVRSRLSTFGDAPEALGLLFPSDEVMESGRKELSDEGEGALELLRSVREAFENIEGWEAEAVASAVRDVGKSLGRRGPALFHPIRLAVMGTRSGPDLGKVLEALGRDEAIRRLDRTLAEMV
jgi:nondiscriminating glutamyl-tRNA synthetase